MIEDVAAEINALTFGPGWSTSEKEVKVLLSTFAFVAQVRLGDGSVWKYDPVEVESGGRRSRVDLPVPSV